MERVITLFSTECWLCRIPNLLAFLAFFAGPGLVTAACAVSYLIVLTLEQGTGQAMRIKEVDAANPRQPIAVPEGFGKLFDQDRVSWGP
jgi:hypothetical protein